MISLVDARFAEWTSGLDTARVWISIFSHIRDIPYSFIVSNPDPKTSPEQLLKAGKGSCGPNHHLHAEMYRKLNLCVCLQLSRSRGTILTSFIPQNSENRLYGFLLRTTLPAGFRSGADGYWWMQRGISLLAGLASRLMNTGTGILK